MIFYIWLAFPVLTLCVFGLAPRGEGHDKPTAVSLITGAESPSSFRTEFLQELAFCEHRFVLIAEAMPADRYSWPPAQGMRSLGRHFAHIAIANYDAIEALDRGEGLQSGPHSGPDPETILAIDEDKPKILEALKNSFAQLRMRILKFERRGRR